MQTRSKKTRAGPQASEVTPQLERFKAMAQEVGADESPEALDRAFGKLDPKKRKETSKPK